jgi:hypothetical protein
MKLAKIVLEAIKADMAKGITIREYLAQHSLPSDRKDVTAVGKALVAEFGEDALRKARTKIQADRVKHRFPLMLERVLQFANTLEQLEFVEVELGKALEDLKEKKLKLAENT